MPSSSDSEDGKGKKQKGYKIGSSGTPVNWNGDDGTFYKHAMRNAFEMSFARWDCNRRGDRGLHMGPRT
ncbi:hypothetical protein PI124_g14807 [Phytophthora idaei]|nr:hypothetical protein PI125_g10240 [Phytophthora idaei]KAG3154843.1 hypothetical protein PI126_g9448 [Phytophthora idaei]KAG3240291.1 hypothetical protein PI124_g14807 [Phytophthora idaei]